MATPTAEKRASPELEAVSHSKRATGGGDAVPTLAQAIAHDDYDDLVQLSPFDPAGPHYLDGAVLSDHAAFGLFIDGTCRIKVLNIRQGQLDRYGGPEYGVTWCKTHLYNPNSAHFKLIGGTRNHWLALTLSGELVDDEFDATVVVEGFPEFFDLASEHGVRTFNACDLGNDTDSPGILLPEDVSPAGEYFQRLIPYVENGRARKIKLVWVVLPGAGNVVLVSIHVPGNAAQNPAMGYGHLREHLRLIARDWPGYMIVAAGDFNGPVNRVREAFNGPDFTVHVTDYPGHVNPSAQASKYDMAVIVHQGRHSVRVLSLEELADPHTTALVDSIHRARAHYLSTQQQQPASD